MTRVLIEVSGMVQGVGFRPFVFRRASYHGLNGWIQNQPGGVAIEVEGRKRALQSFLEDLKKHPSPETAVPRFTVRETVPQKTPGFYIQESRIFPRLNFFVLPDRATCPACLMELRDPENRRHQYPFINCTECGPRLSVMEKTPFDRSRTTMKQFLKCAGCESEYLDPQDRRFHSQLTACTECGPRLEILDKTGQILESVDALKTAASSILNGGVVAMKGLGGFHLICDAQNEKAVTQLRQRKKRSKKPFAIMVCNLAATEKLVEVSRLEEKLLCSPESPIVLMKKKPEAPVAKNVTFDNPELGIMLPYTPLHHRLFDAVGGLPLVMTSGNQSSEPIQYENTEAFQNLKNTVDLFLMHDRPIRINCDDSVVRVADEKIFPIRRSRGYAPSPLDLPGVLTRPTLALGGQFKSTFAMGMESKAVLSHHLGDLDRYESVCSYERMIRRYEDLFQFQPQQLVCDFHPGYASSEYALKRASQENLSLFRVQHHHAHMASCLADNAVDENVIGVTFDGTGYGLDGAVWGGEFLTGSCRGFQRAAHFRYVPMPGGEQAVREPWRMAAAHLMQLQKGMSFIEKSGRFKNVKTIQHMVQNRLHSPLTSSCGRLFDAVSALLGLCDRVSYEGEAAMNLEWLARTCKRDGFYPFGYEPAEDGRLVIDPGVMFSFLLDDLTKGTSKEIIARRFHTSLIHMIGEVCGNLRNRFGLHSAALTGGVFMNTLILQETKTLLSRQGFQVLTHHHVPPNDGGLSLGQLAVAAAQTDSGSPI